MERISGMSKGSMGLFRLRVQNLRPIFDIRDSPNLSNINVALLSWVGLETHNNRKPNHVKVGNLLAAHSPWTTVVHSNDRSIAPP